jgi:hypothetical protein
LIPDDDPEQQIHQLPEQLDEMEPSSDEVCHFHYYLNLKIIN